MQKAPSIFMQAKLLLGLIGFLGLFPGNISAQGIQDDHQPVEENVGQELADWPIGFLFQREVWHQLLNQIFCMFH